MKKIDNLAKYMKNDLLSYFYDLLLASSIRSSREEGYFGFFKQHPLPTSFSNAIGLHFVQIQAQRGIEHVFFRKHVMLIQNEAIFGAS